MRQVQLYLERIRVSSPQNLHQSLLKTTVFKNWLTTHKQSYLSHFFSSISAQLKPKSTWEIGYFNPESQRITVFSQTEQSFTIKQEDDIFKSETGRVEWLELSKIKTNFEDMSLKCQEQIPALFPQESLGDGFVVLQKFEGKIQWNFTFVTKSLKFANIKINAASGAVDSHQLVEAVRREK